MLPSEDEIGLGGNLAVQAEKGRPMAASSAVCQPVERTRVGVRPNGIPDQARRFGFSNVGIVRFIKPSNSGTVKAVSPCAGL
jgi:hypothetical protein